MNPQITKEVRVLLPPLGVLLLAAILPFRSWNGQGFWVVPALFIVCSAIMAALIFGHEFQQRTMSLLLAQPMPRKTIWLLKTGLLALFLALAAGCAVLAFHQYSPQLLTTGTISFSPALDFWAPLIAVPLLVFCTVPWLTLVFRSTLLGLIFSLLIPGALMALNGLFCEYVLRNTGATAFAAYCVLGIYAVVAFPFGYTSFRNLQVIDGTTMGREIELPHGIKKSCAAVTDTLWGQFKGPTATLIRKELRLQQVSFLLAGIFCILAALGALLYMARPISPTQTSIGEVLLGTDFVIYMVLLPILAGSLCLAEEKAWGVADWQLMLPVSRVRQWSIKMAVALSTGLILGFILPLTLFFLGRRLLGLGTGEGFPEFSFVTMLGYLVLLQFVIYAASISGTTVRSILVALCLFLLVGLTVQSTNWGFGGSYGSWMQEGEKVIGRYGLFLLQFALCGILLQTFAFACYRTLRPTIGRITTQILLLVLIICMMTLTTRIVSSM
jgi:hypothetical protein